MASDSNKVRVRLIVFIFYGLLQPSSPRPDLQVAPSPLRELVRNRRQVCVDGTYVHEDRSCCLCAAGQYLKEHCNPSQDYGKCEPCQSGSYNSDPNSFESCRPCTSCSHANANLEVAEACTAARDTKCRCKEGHYCSGATSTCTICQRCTVCNNGVKEPCTATNDTVCDEGNNTVVIVCAVVAVLVGVGIAIAAFLLWRRRQSASQLQPVVQNPSRGNEADVELRLLDVPQVDIQPLLPQIADQLGWKVMQHLAIQSRISDAVIQSCVLDNPHDSQEQTLQLLRMWVEGQGRTASRTLVQSLRDNGKQAKAEKILEILRRNNPAG